MLRGTDPVAPAALALAGSVNVNVVPPLAGDSAWISPP
jgi:hypothetical protein